MIFSTPTARGSGGDDVFRRLLMSNFSSITSLPVPGENSEWIKDAAVPLTSLTLLSLMSD